MGRGVLTFGGCDSRASLPMYEIRYFPNDQIHLARIETRLDPTIARLFGRTCNVNYKTCRTNRAGRRIWGPAPDAHDAEARWYTDDDHPPVQMSRLQAEPKDGAPCLECDP